MLDEVQRRPALFSDLQGVVDADGRMGRFILTGSQQFGLVEAITQSLAGRVSLVHLLPFSLPELLAAGRAPATPDALLSGGLFPPVHDRPGWSCSPRHLWMSCNWRSSPRRAAR